MAEKNISQAVIARLPRYYRYLTELKEQGMERISSHELSSLMRVTASQIRQDFNNFGGFGQQGYGYNIEYLHHEIGNLLGINEKHDMILVGAGNLGTAIMGYISQREMPYSFVAAFDINPALIGKSISGIPIYPIEDIQAYIQNNGIQIAALTVPRAEAIKMAEILVNSGIMAIWNFAHIDLHVPENIQVENVHLLDSLLKLSYNFRNRQ
ncbi:MAG: redox-sensing transcriptional repressor Rex [Lachnospiraceae bacterium]|nr:redox-sensing transcriptional repressor Rex [Lachnospiraceae bacterium]